MSRFLWDHKTTCWQETPVSPSFVPPFRSSQALFAIMSGSASTDLAAATAAAEAAAAAAAAAVVATPAGAPTPGPAFFIFQGLQNMFNFDPKVTSYLVDSMGLESLNDFIHLFTNESEVAELVTNQVPDLKARPLQASRLRQAWLGIKAAHAQEQLVKKRAAEPDDLDEILPQPELDDLTARFWQRYHVRYAPDLEPSDLLVSRLNKEMVKRQLTVMSVWKVKSMTHQLGSIKKRIKLAGNLEYVEPEADTNPTRNLATYLELLFTLCVAYAKAGSRPLETTAGIEGPTSDPTDFVGAPLDLLLRYHHRAKQAAMSLPPGQALTWLQRRDEEERTLWVERSRASELPFGKIVRECFERREAMWDTQQHSGRTNLQPIGDGNPQPAGTPKAMPTLGTTKEGEKPCPAFQRNQCKAKCPQGKKHVCAAVLQGGAICNMRNHGAQDCRNKKRALALN